MRAQFGLDEWYQAAEASIEFQDVEFVVPEDATLAAEHMRTMGLRVGCHKLLLRNAPGWSAVPHIADGRALVATISAVPASAVQTNVQQPEAVTAGGPPPRPAPPGTAAIAASTPPPVPRRSAPKPPPGAAPAVGGAASVTATGAPAGSKWQVSIEGLVLSITNKGAVHLHVAEPADFEVFGRVVKGTPPHLELAVRTSRQKLILSPDVMSFGSAMWASHAAWGRALFGLGEVRGGDGDGGAMPWGSARTC